MGGIIQAGVQIAIVVLKWVFRIGFILAGITALIGLLTLAYGMITVAINFSVLGDLLSLIQLWLPFNLNAVFGWLGTATVTYVAYRLSVAAINYSSRLLD